MSNRELRSQTQRAERQARREARRNPNEYADTYLNMESYNMTPNEEGRKPLKTNDGRDNYRFNKKGEPMVSEASVLTRKRLKKK